MKKLLTFVLMILSLKSFAFNASIETDPLFYLGTKNTNGIYDFNIDFKTDRLKQLRFGFFAWNAEMNQQMIDYLLVNSLKLRAQNLTWTGYGIEMHYLTQSQGNSYIFGLRIQNNNYELTTSVEQKLKFYHSVVTPQVGYQYFLSNSPSGFYLLPWVGAQIPISGDDKIILNDNNSFETRKILPVITVHIGYEY